MAVIYVDKRIQVRPDTPTSPSLGWIKASGTEKPLFADNTPKVIDVITDITSLVKDVKKMSFTSYEVDDATDLKYFVYNEITDKWYPAIIPGKLSFRYDGVRLTLIMPDDFTYSYDDQTKKLHIGLGNDYTYNYSNGKVVISEK